MMSLKNMKEKPLPPRSDKKIPLLPRYGLPLTISAEALALSEKLARAEAPDGSPRRAAGEVFCRRFREVWRRLPLVVRRGILRFWRTWPDPRRKPGHVSGRVRVELTSFRLDTDRGPLTACVADDGWTLSFRPACFDVPLPEEEYLLYTIAHELAHVYRHATRVVEIALWEDDVYDSEEREADALAASWGFPSPRKSRRRLRPVKRKPGQRGAGSRRGC
jgi:hypothetical protein